MLFVETNIVPSASFDPLSAVRFAEPTERLPLVSVQVRRGGCRSKKRGRVWQRTAAFHQRFVAASGMFNVTYARAYEHFENSLKFSFHRNNHFHHNKHLVFITFLLLPFCDVVLFIFSLCVLWLFRWRGLKPGAIMKISWKKFIWKLFCALINIPILMPFHSSSLGTRTRIIFALHSGASVQTFFAWWKMSFSIRFTFSFTQLELNRKQQSGRR